MLYQHRANLMTIADRRRSTARYYPATKAAEPHTCTAASEKSRKLKDRFYWRRQLYRACDVGHSSEAGKERQGGVIVKPGHTIMEATTGSRVLGVVEEASLEEILDDLRRTLDADQNQHNLNHVRYVKPTYLGELDDLVVRHFRATQVPNLSICGRNLPLLYKIISTLISMPHKMSLFVLDLEGRFDATCLDCTETDLQHVYVQQPGRDAGTGNNADYVRSFVAEAETFMLYSDVARTSISRKWWGTIVVGGLGAGDLIAGWRGWLRIDREHVPEFAPGISAETAYERRPTRQEAVDAAGWAATSRWGNLIFNNEEGSIDALRHSRNGHLDIKHD
ncbi:hypothetical protein PT974_09232 [Cladobotryum mycophilum]|uniref:Uncharacterized protein n=1 Tax=Cladobotryum mycophilum TaxID=491253 RepID=A0ABR0SFJ1_9HYPO